METSEEKCNLYVKSDTHCVVAAGSCGTGNEEAGGGEHEAKYVDRERSCFLLSDWMVVPLPN
jgi:hypothetical protein